MRHRARPLLLVCLAPAICLPAAEEALMAAPTTLITWPGPEGIAPSPLYEVTANGRSVFVYGCTVGKITDANGGLLADRPETAEPDAAAFCCFDFAGGPVEVKVRVKGPALNLPVKSAVVRPTRHGIRPRIDGDTIAFALAKPCKITVEPNGSIVGTLHVFSSAPEKDPPKPGDANVIYYGPGVHVMGVKALASGQTLYIAGGAVVRGHVNIVRAENVAVRGRGVLDASLSPRKGAEPRANRYGVYGCLSRVHASKNVTLDGICMMDSPAWTLQIMHSEDVTARNLKLITWRENGDGIDVCTSRNVTVEGCFLRCWDDALVVKAHLIPKEGAKHKSVLAKWTPADLEHYTPGIVRDVTFRDCVVWLDRAHALEIGQETAAAEIANVVFRDIDIIHDFHICAIDIGNGDRARVHDVLYERIRIEDPRSAELFRFHAGPNYWSVDKKMGVDAGTIENIVLKDIEVFGRRIPPSTFRGWSIRKDFKGVKIDGITFRNLRFNGKVVTDEKLARFRKGPLVGKVTLEP